VLIAWFFFAFQDNSAEVMMWMRDQRWSSLDAGFRELLIKNAMVDRRVSGRDLIPNYINLVFEEPTICQSS